MSSGNVLADRRYAYGAASLAEGDFPAANDLARQTLELAPEYGPAFFLLGEALERGSRDSSVPPEEAEAMREDAAQAFRMALERDPTDPQGARLRLAALGVGDAAAAMTADYVRALFDNYAPRFDRHLVRSLAYCGPVLIAGGLRRACSRLGRPFAFGAALDLGCGTGLAGEALRDACRHLAGIDLSPAMVAKAARKRIYDELETGDLVGWLKGRPPGAADLAVAADVLVYLGDLGPVFAAVANALAPGGLFAVTAQRPAHDHQGDDARLGDDLRFAHSDGYLGRCAAGAGFTVVLLEQCSTREDRGLPVPGTLAVLERQSTSVSANSSPL